MTHLDTGYVDVYVTNPGGTTKLTNGYWYNS